MKTQNQTFTIAEINARINSRPNLPNYGTREYNTRRPITQEIGEINRRRKLDHQLRTASAQEIKERIKAYAAHNNETPHNIEQYWRKLADPYNLKTPGEAQKEFTKIALEWLTADNF